LKNVKLEIFNHIESQLPSCLRVLTKDFKQESQVTCIYRNGFNEMEVHIRTCNENFETRVHSFCSRGVSMTLCAVVNYIWAQRP